MRCAIFCTVIDNFGDIGVCWRLARQLATEYQLEVTLFVDDLNSFAQLAPDLNPNLATQSLDNINVQHWHSNVKFAQPFEIIIEGFGCRLSDILISQMQQQAQDGHAPVWINLEYLSAENWVLDCHGMTSIHPATGLKQIFWFPSVTANSGGLIREKGLIDQRQQFQQQSQQQSQQQEMFWQSLNLSNAMQFDRKISLFSYENHNIANLMNALAEDTLSTLLLVPKSKSIPDIEHWLISIGVNQKLHAGDQVSYQNLTIAVLPFLLQPQYDQLLWACDLNFVRGEDSCVRAQWAGRPFIWHIYPQDDNVHLTKLQAWIDQVEGVAGDIPSWQLAMHTWNEAALSIPTISSPAIWQNVLDDVSVWATSFTLWSNYLSGQPDLAMRLMHYIFQQKLPR